MTRPNTFISYSRQCMGFVDDLAHRLEREGFRVWLDYRSLVPGRPWVEQIGAGLGESQLLLLVVSGDSMASRNVELEWRRFLEEHKRVILLIFEAVHLPPELGSLEWVDFRGGYRAALKKLLQSIDSPAPPTGPAPQSGFKAPAGVWLAAGLGLLAGFYSLFAAWTIFIPWLLVPLGWQVLKRDFNLSRVQTALWMLPVGIFFSIGLFFELGPLKEPPDFDFNHFYSFYNIALLVTYLQIYIIPFTAFLTLLILRLPVMQRWGRPEASVPKFANLYRPDVPEPRPVSFYIDHATQDGLVARELSNGLMKYGHTQAAGIDSAEAVFVLVSRYKTDTQADPQKQVVYPVVVQRARISEKLSQVQWIDFRKGIRNLDAMGQLLPQPARMLAALGVRPTSGGQGAMPNIVLALVDYLIIMAVVDLGSMISYLFELQHVWLGMILELETARALWLLSLQMGSMLLAGGLIYLMIRALTERSGRLASGLPFLVALAALLLLFTWQAVLGDELESLFNRYWIFTEAMFAALPFLFMVTGGLLVGIAAVFRWKRLRLWFPARKK